MAQNPSPKDSALHLAATLNNLLSEKKDDFTEVSRIEALKLAKELVATLEKPEDALLKLLYQPALIMAIRVAMDLDIFRILSDEELITAKGLSEKTGAAEDLIVRIMRAIIAGGIVAEEDVSTYRATPLSKQLHQRGTVGAYELIYDLGYLTIAKTPEFFTVNNHQSPDKIATAPLEYAEKIDGSFFEWIGSDPGRLRKAHQFFEGDRGSRPSWLDWFPVEEKLIKGSKEDKTIPLIVDIGGSRGHDIEAFRQRFPNPRGKLILADLQHVVSNNTHLDPAIEQQTFDFFKGPPMKGARIYYMRFVLHDWSDEDCRIILKNVKSAMDKDYTYLVIEDFILPDTGCHEISALWDLWMMVFLRGAKERARSQWVRLLESVGLEIEGFYNPQGDGQGVILAKLGTV